VVPSVAKPYVTCSSLAPAPPVRRSPRLNSSLLFRRPNLFSHVYLSASTNPSSRASRLPPHPHSIQFPTPPATHVPARPPQRPDAPSPAFHAQTSLSRISSLPHVATATSACLVPNPTQSIAVVRSLARRLTSTIDQHGGDGDIASLAAPPPGRPTLLDPRGRPAARIWRRPAPPTCILLQAGTIEINLRPPNLVVWFAQVRLWMLAVLALG
jgi:hypothetical protein